MLPSKQNDYSTEPIRKEQNYVFAPETPKQSRLEKLDVEWKMRLKKLLNNIDDQIDYFQICPEESNTSISTICIDSNASQYTESHCSDTDATRRDDIIVQLSESAFYKAKINLCPLLNFPPATVSRSSHSSWNVDEDDHDTEPASDAKNDVVDQFLGDNCASSGLSLEELKMNLEKEMESRLEMKLELEKEIEMELKLSPKLNPNQEAASLGGRKSASIGEKELPKSKTNQESSSLGSQKSLPKSNTNQESASLSSRKSTSISEKKIPKSNTNQESASLGGRKSASIGEKELPKSNTNQETASLDRFNSKTSRNSHPLRGTVSEKELPKSNAANNGTDENDNIVNGAASKPSSVVSSSLNNSPNFEQRKKRCSTSNRNKEKRVDTNRRMNVELEQSDSSDCTKITSTTTVQVTTNDDAIFEALEDLPDFINSSVVELASCYIDDQLKLQPKQRRFIDYKSDFESSSSSASWRNPIISSSFDEYISAREAYDMLNTLLRDGTKENRKAVMYDEYNDIRLDDEIASSEEEFLSDIDDLELNNRKWTPPESELRRQVAIILGKLNPLEHNYIAVVNDMLSKYLNYIHHKQRLAKLNRIMDVVDKPISQQEKTELLIQREFDDKKLNREFYYSPKEPQDFTELCERRRDAIVKKYTKCHNDRTFCHNYFRRSIEDRSISKLAWRVSKLKKELGLIFA